MTSSARRFLCITSEMDPGWKYLSEPFSKQLIFTSVDLWRLPPSSRTISENNPTPTQHVHVLYHHCDSPHNNWIACVYQRNAPGYEYTHFSTMTYDDGFTEVSATNLSQTIDPAHHPYARTVFLQPLRTRMTLTVKWKAWILLSGLSWQRGSETDL